MQREGWLSRIDWGHIVVILGIGTAICIYLFDAIQASSRVGNLVLILPAALVGLLLCLITLASVVRDARREIAADTPAPEVEPFHDRVRPLLMLGLFALYILLLPVLGMDLGSAIFLALALVANGERRVIFILLYSVIFSVLATLLFKSILPYPMHTLFL